jgi:DNA-binding transcriptional MerR regulator
MPETYTPSDFAEVFNVSPRQIRNYLKTIKSTTGCDPAIMRGHYPKSLLPTLEAIQKVGIAAWKRQQSSKSNAFSSSQKAIVPTVIPSVTPYSDGSGLSSAVDVLALARERLAMQRRDLNQREKELDQRASERDNALRELYRIAAENEAQRIALDRREIFDRALDRQLGDAASRTLWEQPSPKPGNAQAS